MLKNIEKQTLTVHNKMELGEDISVEAKGKGRKFVSRFIEPGVAHYEEFGDVLITKETLDRFINTMVGCPVIIQHKDIDDENVDKERVGVISNVWFNEFDGWYYCDGIIWDKQAIDLIKNQEWSVSCTYDFDSDKLEKTHNGKKIDMEFTGGEFLHLALVPNPRYERANIVMNSKELTNENDEHEPGGSPKGGQFAKKDIKVKGKELLDKVNEKFNLNLNIDFEEGDVNEFQKDNNKVIIKKDLSKEFDNFQEYMFEEYKIKPKQYGIKGANEDSIYYHEIAHSIIYDKEGILEDFINKNNELHKEEDFMQYAGEVSGHIGIYDKSNTYESQKEFFCETFADLMINGKDNNISTELLYKLLKQDAQNSKGDLTMSVLNELESFVKGIIKNAEDEKEKEEVKNEDKRKLIEEVGGILKGKVDDEIIKTIMKKMEEASYEPSEDKKADNEADEEEKEEKFEEEKKIANKCKNEEEKEEKENKVEDEDDEKDEDDEVDKEEVKNKCKNSMKDVKEIIMGGKSKIESDYISKADRFALGEKY